MRRSSATRAHVVLLGALVMMLGCRSEDVRRPRANVVLLSIDTWRADHLSVHGYARPTSPALEGLARDAIVFDRAFSAAPQTAPSHMSLLTGVPPLAHGIWNIGVGPTTPTLATSIRTLAEMLHAQGYRTAAFTGGGNVRRETGFGRGFDWFDENAHGGMNGNGLRSLEPASVLAWLAVAKSARAPFFMFLHTYIPHSPYLPPPPYDTRYDPEYRGRIPSDRARFFAQIGGRDDTPTVNAAFFDTVDRRSPADLRHLIALYDGECNAADDAVGVFLRALDGLGLRDDTIFIVTSDHGEQFLEHGAFVHPTELWDELLHVPLVVALPATRGRGRHVRALASGLDLVPTVLDLVGLPADPQPMGRSLVPLLAGRDDWSDERAVVSEITARVTAGAAAGATHEPLRALRTTRHKLIQRMGARRTEQLYDLVADPGEQHDVHDAAEHAAALARLRAASDAIDRAELARRGVSGEQPVSATTRDELRALGYLE